MEVMKRTKKRFSSKMKVVAHGNSLRSLTKHIEGISDEDIMGVEIATGEPIIYDIDEHLNVVNKTILYKK